MKIQFCCNRMKKIYDTEFIRYKKSSGKMMIEMHTAVGTPGEDCLVLEIDYCPFCGEKIE